MSAENNQSLGESSPLLPTSQQSTHIFSSEPEYTKGEGESSKEDSPFSKENENLEEESYLEKDEDIEEESYLEEDEDLEEEGYLEEDEDLEEEGYLEEDEDLEEEGYLEEDESLDEENYLERDESLEEEKYLKEKSYLNEQDSLKEKKYLQEEKKSLYEEAYLENELKETYQSKTLLPLTRSPAASTSQAITFLTTSPLTLELVSKSFSYFPKPSTSSLMGVRESLSLQDEGTQTKRAFGTRATSKLKLRAELEASTTSIPAITLDSEGTISKVLQEDEHATKSVPQTNLFDDTLNENTGTQEVRNRDGTVSRHSYHTVLKTIMKELTAQNELAEDVDIPLTGHLESGTRRKLGILLKTNIEKYKEIIHWIMKKRDGRNVSLKTPTTVTHSFHALDKSPQIEEPKIEKVEKPHRVVHRKEKLEVDTEWTKKNIKAHQDDLKLIIYSNENIFRIIFPDGSGQIHYPSGNLAMLILSMRENVSIYIILEDSEEGCIRALINNTGHATFYDENREIWLSLSRNLGYYFAKGKHQKAWNWWNLNVHVHAPPVQSISLIINQYIKVQIRRQDQIIFSFIHQTKHIYLNLGTKYKFIVPEKLSEMKQKAVLEVEFTSTARRIQVLLGKMSRILNFLTISDLKTFLEDSRFLLLDTTGTRF